MKGNREMDSSWMILAIFMVFCAGLVFLSGNKRR
jgi:cbb3-type cytochrome oxidase subunit 3